MWRFRMRIFRSAIVLAAVGLIPTSYVLAEQPAGKAVVVNPSATASNPEGVTTLTVGSDVAMGDKVKTDSEGEVQLLFSDDTRLVVGPNSSLVIEAYLLRSQSRANNFTVRALGGTFRMITGKSEKSAYKIKTPTATIGVRGTSFDFTVTWSGATGLVLYDGAARICGQNGRCQDVKRRCSIAEAPRKGDVRLLGETNRRTSTIARNFHYLGSQESLREDFRVPVRGCEDVARVFDLKDRTPTPPSVTGSIAEPEPAPDPEPGPDPDPGPGPAPDPDPGPAPETPGSAGNPGNGRSVGNAGPNPSNNDFGDTQRGRSDTAPGRSGSKGNNGRSNNGRGRS